MSMWKKTLVYLGLVEEPDEYDEMPERFEEQARAARPAMHDTTGPIAVVRPDHEEDFGLSAVAGRAQGAGAAGGSGGGFRTSTADADLTEPVGRVEGAGREQAAAEPPRRGREESRPTRAGRRDRATRAAGDEPPAGEARGRGESSNVRALRPEDGSGSSMPDGLGRRVAIVAVTDYEESAREVGTRYRQGSPVIFDLTDAPTDSRKRVLDFVAGTIFALNGEMLKVGARSFLVVPKGTDIPEREWTRLATLGYRP